ncbi:MAG: hypothetical protein WBF90_31220 [Rivularia sp. (in: cyanobacteria)]|jgi:hypothetical protein
MQLFKRSRYEYVCQPENFSEKWGDKEIRGQGDKGTRRQAEE